MSHHTDIEKAASAHDEHTNGYGGGHPLHHSISTDTQRAFPVYHRKLGNPTPLGLFSFASTVLILSFYNVGTRGINVPNVLVGMTMGVGGLCQLLSGMWEFATGNTFGATAFSIYGGFWFSFGLIYWPSSGILDAYAGDAVSQLPNALGIYLTTWTIITFIMLVATFKSSVALIATFFFLLLTFIVLTASQFTGSLAITKAGGVLGLVTGFLALYVGCAGLYSPDASYFVLPVGNLAKED
ncbi:glyoxylate pathway regulator [Ceratobasidium sp. AG-Ba]|nr:glyoxylate pathway regulator [Ceratobasidium sp. AG-Ba]QRW10638.1 glyoxylate pathway regulator [Ceratobasidium sp. AG-Ba]